MLETKWLAIGIAMALLAGIVLLITLRPRPRRTPCISARRQVLVSAAPTGDWLHPGLRPPPAPEERDTSEDLFKATFHYVDARGYRTAPIVSVMICDDDFFAGYCHVRRDYRTFLWQNVDGSLTLETGERASPVQLKARYLPANLGELR